ncbi:multidrug transporter MatE [Candidatus Epulonipiscioides gigas]|nr:multidrug transporter MatE [Epulopiscium sp. SCG-C07WGA-EpuloA2]
MNLVHGNIKQIYLKYLIASFGGAILPSVYGLVDMIVVGQYHGPLGSATMAIIAPIWNVIYSFGLLTGIGASILFSIQKNSKENANEYFTMGFILTTVIALVLWLLLIFFEDAILITLGADKDLLPLAKQYLIPVKLSVPIFLFMQFFAAFLRNDNNPMLSTKAIIFGGIFNIIGDIVFVFTFNLGIIGAGIATCIGASFSLVIMLSHFKSQHNTLRFIKTKNIFNKVKQIIVLGFSTFFIDIAMGILTMLFNIQIMKYLDSNALAVYGIIVNISTFVQCCAYGIGQASQPILSTNFGANQFNRIKELFKYNVVSLIILSLAWVIVTMSFPNIFVYAFMKPTIDVLEIAPTIIRLYCMSFLLLPFNIYATYYFQSILKANIAFIIAISRGLIISGGLILVLPMVFSAQSIWMTMPLTELIVFIFTVIVIRKSLINR